MVNDRRNWLMRIGCLNSKESGYFNPKGLFGVLWNRLNWCMLDDWFYDISGLLRSASLKFSGLPLLWYLLSILVFRLRLDCYARKSFYACCIVQGGCWYVDRDTVLAVDPFTNCEPGWSYGRSLFTFFCNLVSCPYAGSLGCVCG